MELLPELSDKLKALLSLIKEGRSVIAFSGGVDSATLAKAMAIASREDGDAARPVGFFAESSSSTKFERAEARRVAEEVGIELRVVKSNEFDDERFVKNPPDRCYWCKKIRFSAIRLLADQLFANEATVRVFDGTNADDSGDFRPGTRAAIEVGVVSPFAKLGFTKADIRTLAAYWGISVAQKPSNPCLATRVAYGLPLRDDILRRIELAEIAVKEILGVNVCRARVDAPFSVRIEIPEDRIAIAATREFRSRLAEAMLKIGFNFVSLDLEGFVSGKNNRGAV